MIALTPRAPAPVPGLAALDEQQHRAVTHRGPRLRVVGAPGTGKTTVTIRAVLDRLERDGLVPGECLVLTADRARAAELRDRLAAGVGAAAATDPMVRTPASLAHAVLTRQARHTGMPQPRLLSGAEQDVIVADLLAGHSAGIATAPHWPHGLQAALPTRAFRTELRELLMRAAEYGLGPDDLTRLGQANGMPQWEAAARFLSEYDEVMALARPGAYDSASMLSAAADVLDADPAQVASTWSGLRLLVVDDAQDMTAAAARLVWSLAVPGVHLILVGDPDSATQTFRGADPLVSMRDWDPRGQTPTIVLRHSYRQSAALGRVTARVAARIGAAGQAAHRGPVPAPAVGAATCEAAANTATVAVYRSEAEQARQVASALRRAHLLDQVPWSQMAVITRTIGSTGTLLRGLARYGVPVRIPGVHAALRDNDVVVALLSLLRVVVAVCDRPVDLRDPVDPEMVRALLASPLGGADPLTVRRLRRALRYQEDLAGGSRNAEQLLVDGLLGDGLVEHAGADGLALCRLAEAVRTGVGVLRQNHAPDAETVGTARGGTVHPVLWAVWQSCARADQWRQAALAGGSAGQRADDRLDAVVALFDAAAEYDRTAPGRGLGGFIDHVNRQEVGSPVLAPQAQLDEAVTVTTAAGAAGRQWRFVVVCGVQRGVWPDLRLRGSMLGANLLVDLIQGRGTSTKAARVVVRHDELRLFHVAVSRATQRLLVTAVRSEEEHPSGFLDLVDPQGDPTTDGEDPPDGRRTSGRARPQLESAHPIDVHRDQVFKGDPESAHSGVPSAPRSRPFAAEAAPATLPALVARLRRQSIHGAAAAERDSAARMLAVLAVEGVDGAHPTTWWSTRQTSDQRDRRAPDQPLVISASHLESLAQCEYRWLMSQCGGQTGTANRSSAIGDLIHAIAASVDGAEESALHAELDRRWPDPETASGWLTRRDKAWARDMLTRLAEHTRSTVRQGWQVVGCEVPLEAEVGAVTLRGRVDRLERHHDGQWRVVDLKTGSNKPTKAQLERQPQLGAYQLLLRESVSSPARQGKPSDSIEPDPSGPPAPPDETTFSELANETADPQGRGGAALLQLGKAAPGGRADLQCQRPLTADQNPNWPVELVERAVRTMAAANVCATSGGWCRTCPYAESCPTTTERNLT